MNYYTSTLVRATVWTGLNRIQNGHNNGGPTTYSRGAEGILGWTFSVRIALKLLAGVTEEMRHILSV